MATSLGIDTGGTYTDAVVFDDERGVVAKAKALTTRHDLTIGVAQAVGAVLALAEIEPGEIRLVSLSTTLATNALVEGRGARVALIFIGFDDDDAGRAGLDIALNGDPLIRVGGGHNSHGDARAGLDLVALEREVRAVAPSVSGFAITAQFGTRNPAHEIAARELVISTTGLPVTCGHELTAKLDGPRRALTSVFNARLIGLISSLILAAEQIMKSHRIAAPLMVVRGDGALMSAAVAKVRPIETILSGPAASVIGASFLTQLDDAMISDIGGTTTDVAVIRNGVPQLDPRGASVGGVRTMVEAVAMTTVGLGGDSEVSIVTHAGVAEIVLGPRRVVPLCLAALEQAALIHQALDRQLLSDLPGDHDARFVVATGDSGASESGLSAEEAEMLAVIRRGICAADRVLRGRAGLPRLNTLVRRGLVLICAFTPTDAAHVIGADQRFDPSVSHKAASLMARQRNPLGRPIAADGVDFADRTVAMLQRRSAETLLDVAFQMDGFSGNHLSRHALVRASLDRHVGAIDLSARIAMPVVGLGASAGLYYPAVAELIRTTAIVPPDADVANAIGAVVGQVRTHVDVYVSQPERGRYRVHHPEAVEDIADQEVALDLARSLARHDAQRSALVAGAEQVEVVISQTLNIVSMEGEEFFVDATLTATASGRPGIAR